MSNFVFLYFLEIKAFHIISVISWMAGLFYLPRLFVYHCKAGVGSEMSETFKVMERKLYKIIMMPAMLLSIISGYLLVLTYWETLWNEFWLLFKLGAALILVIFHFYLGHHLEIFSQDKNTHPEEYYRVINELPTILMFIIVIFGVLKPGSGY